MKITFSLEGRAWSPWLEVRWHLPTTVAFGLAALWPHATPWACWHGVHRHGVTRKVGAGDLWVQAQPAGSAPRTPTLLGAVGGECCFLSLVRCSGIRCWEENSVH